MRLASHLLLISVALIVGLGATGCQKNVKPDVAVVPAPTVLPTPPPKPLDPMAAARGQLLKQAETAFRQGRYFEPVHDNAFDGFHAVLLLDPHNETARTGVQAILLRHASLIRDAIRQKRYRDARRVLGNVEQYYPAHPLVMDLKKHLGQSKPKVVKRPTPRAEQGLKREKLSLPAEALSKKSEDLKVFLSQLGARLKSTDESILIFARNDREGRWIYQQIKRSTPGYRVRGDIRIARTPEIHILPPL